MDELATPWSEFLSASPPVVFYRDNAQGYVVKRWHNLDVEVEVAEVSGLEGATHAITGSGTLVGRETRWPTRTTPTPAMPWSTVIC